MPGIDFNSALLAADHIKELAHSLGASVVGIVPSGPVKRENEFIEWLNRGYAADMDYLKRYQNQRFDPEKLLPGAKAIIVIGVNYFNPDEPDSAKNPYKVARFAWGEDYHRILRKMLKRIRNRLAENVAGLKGRICVDTAPFMDKYWAEQAGIGWQGKHTNLISRKFGNWLSLGSLIINAKVDEYDNPHKDYCGTCTRCLEACPTGALVEPYVLDANLCISYWTVESKDEKIPDNIADKLNNYVFGCDICLAVCPYNRGQRPTNSPELKRSADVDRIESGEAAEYSEEEFRRKYSRSMLNRRGVFGIKRNLKASQKNGRPLK